MYASDDCFNDLHCMYYINDNCARWVFCRFSTPYNVYIFGPKYCNYIKTIEVILRRFTCDPITCAQWNLLVVRQSSGKQYQQNHIERLKFIIRRVHTFDFSRVHSKLSFSYSSRQ